MFTRIIALVKTNPIRRGFMLVVLSQGVLLTVLFLREGELPPAHITIPCAIGFFAGSAMMFIGTLVWLHRRKKRD